MRKRKGVFALLLAAFLTVTTLSGAEETESLSSDAAKEPSEKARRIYELYLDDGNLVYFNGNGELLPDEEPDFYVVYDVLSGDVAYYVREKTVLTGEFDENGKEIVIEYRALYSPDGTLVADWQPRCYINAIGKLVTYYTGRGGIAYLSTEEAHAVLWNPLTDTVVLEDACFLQHCTDTSAVAVNADMIVLGVVDTEGNHIPAPMTFRYSLTRYGYILGSEYKKDENGEIVTDSTAVDQYLFDSEMNLLLSGRFYSFTLYRDGIFGEYLSLRGYPDAVRKVVRLSDLKTVFRVPSGMDLSEFDGEHAVLCEKENPRGTYAIYDLSGEMIAGPYGEIFAESRHDLDVIPPDFLFAVTGETVYKIDWEGNVLAEREIENFHSIDCVGGGRYLYRITPIRNGKRDYDNIQFGVLDENLNIVLEVGASGRQGYSCIGYFGCRGNDPVTDNPRFLAKRTAVNGQEVYCLLDENGEVLLDGISQVGSYIENSDAKKGPTAVAVRRGFSIGLIDWNGNWVKEYSIFDKIGD